MVNSNATPIRHCRDQGYTCCFCPEQYPIAADLKMHTIQEHDEEALKKVIQEMRIYTVKLDITSLQCAVCQSDVSTIEELMEHLIKMHNRQIYTDIKNHMIPFKFNGDELQCAMCPTKCSTFRNLTEHMNNHYRNYECNVCGAGFVNRDLLRSHKRIHKTGSFACDFCPKIFDTLVRKQAHTNSLHRKSSKKHICRYCNEQFVDYHKKKEHLFVMHGVKLVERKCEVCNKGFMKQTALRNHIRKFHFMEKEVKCELCDKMFFARKDMVRHMVRHTGTPDFVCNLCGKAFTRRSVLKQHMRVHAKDRRTPKRDAAQYIVIVQSDD